MKPRYRYNWKKRQRVRVVAIKNEMIPNSELDIDIAMLNMRTLYRGGVR